MISEKVDLGDRAHGIAPETIKGVEAFKQFVRNVREVFPEVRATVEDAVSQGDKVALRIGLDLARGSTAIHVAGMGIARIVDGKIAEAWNLWDVPALLAAIGEPTPARNIGDAVALAAKAL